MRKSWNVVDYQESFPDVDYSEVVTEPGLVLSMREIFERYAAQGINLLEGELIGDDHDDDEVISPDFDDKLDALSHMRNVASLPNGRRKRSASKPSKQAMPADKPQESPTEPQRSEGDGDES